ncbi:hypothetical protein [Peribacillus frigoritolerans]
MFKQTDSLEMTNRTFCLKRWDGLKEEEYGSVKRTEHIDELLNQKRGDS